MNLDRAETIADAAVYILLPFCSHITIAGSIRRQKAVVNDIELVVVPKLDESKDLFGNVTAASRSAAFCKATSVLGKCLKGDVATGRYLQIMTPYNIKLDLFITTQEDYWRQVAIRTGPAEYSHNVLAIAWRQKGWVGTKDGLRRYEQCINIGTSSKPHWICNVGAPKLPPVWHSEHEFYQWIGLNYITPDKRNV